MDRLPQATSHAPTAEPIRALPQVPDHQLLCRIGEGSFGEVWLAQSALGRYRAVKVVRRERFETTAEYERECRGLERFEPVSRTHQGLVDVLQFGRHDAGGYFYYVMELADPLDVPLPLPVSRSGPDGLTRPGLETSSMAFAAAYRPRTLRADLRRRGRWSVGDSISLGLSLSSALAHLHDAGLVHRDLKPSNVIFVDGQPKLADIGLVARVDEAQSWVGTVGYIAPEGPGAPAADLYSLGKLLYETCTGRDRQEFPRLPPEFRELPDGEGMRELNEIILKACEPDARRRYPTAQAMQAELASLRGGRSIRRLRALERRLAQARRAGAVVSGLLVLAASLYLFARSQARRLERELYVSDVNLAYQAWEVGHVHRARALIQSHRDRSGKWRGFEWALSQRLFASEGGTYTLAGHTNHVLALAVTSNPGRIATAGLDRTVKLWDSATGQLLASRGDHEAILHAVAFSPNGRYLASAGRDRVVRLWEVDPLETYAVLSGHTDAIRAVGFLPDGEHLISAGEDRSIRVWSIASRREVGRWNDPWKIEQLAISADGRLLATCGFSPQVRLWSLPRGEFIGLAGEHRAHASCLALSPDNRLLASAGFDGEILLWGLAEGKPVGGLGRGAPVRSLAFSPDSDILAAGTYDGLIHLWQPGERREGHSLRGHARAVDALAFSRDGLALVSAGQDNLAKIWDADAFLARRERLQHSGFVNAVSISADGIWLATAEVPANRWLLWDLETGRCLRSSPCPDRALWCLAFSPLGSVLATGGLEGSLRLWDPQAGHVFAMTQAHAEAIEFLAWSPNGHQVASASRDGAVGLWEVPSLRLNRRLESGRGPVRTVAFSPQGELLAAAGYDHLVRLWKVADGSMVRVLPGHKAEVRAVAFSPGGNLMASADAEQTVLLWDTHSCGAPQRLEGHAALVSSIAFSADGRTLATGSWDCTVKLWNLALGKDVATLRGHAGQVNQVAFSPDGTLLGSASADGMVRLWRTRESIAKP
jgi:WD40 repeat protein